MSKQSNQMVVRYKSLADGSNAAFKWENSLDKILSPGCFLVEIDHKEGDMGLPIEFCGDEHYMVGTLIVCDCGTNGPIQCNRVIGQVLTFASRQERETKIFTRTYADDKWGIWRAMAQTGMYDDIANADELFASVTELVTATRNNEVSIASETARAVEVEQQLADNIVAVEKNVRNTIINYNDWKNTDAELSLSAVLADNDFVNMVTGGTFLIFKYSATDWKRYQYVGAGVSVPEIKTLINWRELSGATYGIRQTVDADKVQISTSGENGKVKYIINISSATNERAGVMCAVDKRILNENVLAIANEVTRARMAEENIIHAIERGDTMAGVSRDVYSLQGKLDVASFLRRTTAGNTTINRGAARLLQLGGNVIKNLVDGTLLTGWSARAGFVNSFTMSNGIAVLDVKAWGGITHPINLVMGHKYYARVQIKSAINRCYIYIPGSPSDDIQYSKTVAWSFLTRYFVANGSEELMQISAYDQNTAMYILGPLLIDLTEMFGVGNEPTRGECDVMFTHIGTLSKGVNVAKPAAFKSVRYNQCDALKAVAGKVISEGEIVDGDNYLVPMPCLACKTGTGENNGYVISTGEGDTWSEEAIVAVYYSPLNPLEVTGELFLQKIEPQDCVLCNGAHKVYVPVCDGWLLIETASLEKLCAHFAWSGDRAVTDYEEYVESTITLPEIPQMSEHGLAGIQSSGTYVGDTIDYDKMIYTKRIGCVDLGKLPWRYDDVNLIFATANPNNIIARPPAAKYANAVVDGYTLQKAVPGTVETLNDKSFKVFTEGALYLKDLAYTDSASFTAAMQGVMLYFELATPEEYPIMERLAPAYVASDYGTEEFEGTTVPLQNNMLFYMRSLVGELRNFLDRLMAGLGVSDVVAAADRIVAALATSEVEGELPAENVDETTIE